MPVSSEYCMYDVYSMLHVLAWFFILILKDPIGSYILNILCTGPYGQVYSWSVKNPLAELMPFTRYIFVQDPIARNIFCNLYL
jgi:hypothetical protein